MRKNILDSQRSWFGDAIGGAWKLVRQGIDLPATTDAPLYAELRILSAPHMAVLVYKRAKHSGTVFNDERWSAELNEFVTRMLWPYLAQSPVLEGRSRNTVVEMLDTVVATEQRKAAETVDDLPYTSRFDTSWAI